MAVAMCQLVVHGQYVAEENFCWRVISIAWKIAGIHNQSSYTHISIGAYQCGVHVHKISEILFFPYLLRTLRIFCFPVGF